jgi:hypothetical protein
VIAASVLVLSKHVTDVILSCSSLCLRVHEYVVLLPESAKCLRVHCSEYLPEFAEVSIACECIVLLIFLSVKMF